MTAASGAGDRRHLLHGRPIVGSVAGLAFGVFVALDVLLLGWVRLDSPVVSILPAAGIALGVFLAAWAPIKGPPPDLRPAVEVDVEPPRLGGPPFGGSR